jgi:hypothetical protein
MTLPAVPKVVIRLGTGPSFGNVLILGNMTDGILGTNVLGTDTIEAVDISSQVLQISTRRGRDRIFEEYNAGTATVRFQDFTGDWNPENVTGPYYGQILPMRQIIITADYEGVGYPIFAGYITNWSWEWADAAADYAIVTVQCVDAMRLLQLAEVTTVPLSAAGDLPGTRILLILSAINWPVLTMAVATPGDTTLQADPGTSRTALEAIQTVEDSDLGWFFIDRSGVAVYLSRNNLSLRATLLPVLFEDVPSFLRTRYQNVSVGLDDTELANSVTFTRVGGTAQTATDGTAVATYFRRSFERSGLMMETDTVALNRATAVLNYRKDPKLRIGTLVLDLSSPSNRISNGLFLDYGYPINLTKQFGNGTDFDFEVIVTGMAHDITPDRWTMRITTAEPLSVGFVLGSARFGILGTSTL